MRADRLRGYTLVAGCGWLGDAVACQLAALGADVVGVRRHPRALRPFPVVRGDLVRPSDLVRDLPRPIARVVYAVGADERSPDAYRLAYVEGQRRLRDALDLRGDRVVRWVFTSSTVVYGESSGGWVDEQTPPSPRDALGAIALEGELAARTGETAHVVLRLAGLYGPGRDRLVREAAAAETVLDPEPSYTNRIHRDDAAALVLASLSHPDPPPLVIGVDDEPADRADVLRYLARRLGVPEPRIDPARPSRPHKRCRSRARSELVPQLQYPTFREGYAETVARAQAAATRAVPPPRDD
jgi:nucleoside-diphosphate-sugar epimerase